MQDYGITTNTFFKRLRELFLINLLHTQAYGFRIETLEAIMIEVDFELDARALWLNLISKLNPNAQGGRGP